MQNRIDQQGQGAIKQKSSRREINGDKNKISALGYRGSPSAVSLD